MMKPRQTARPPRAAPPRKGRPRSARLDEIEKRLHVARRQARRIAKEVESGADIDTIEEAKLRKLTLEGDKLELQLAVLRREYFPAAKIYEHFLSAFTVFKSELLRLETALPPLLAGLPPEQMQPVIRAEVETALNNLAERNWPS
ncbi:MAG: hypothetical protein LBD30_00305 [Verrucomicrobiales bacterium]|jgi:hypothetical protein|nr:hypothetical protein [Verrucomicrobiales bacterium]